mgnify:CR=1 FL=1
MKLETIYKQTKTGATQEWTIEVVGNKYRTISGQTDGKKVTNEWTVVYGKNEGRANATTDKEQAMKEAEAKRKLKLERGYFENIKHIGKKQYFEPMLAAKWEDYKDKVEYPIFSQPKLDGIRCIVTKDGMFRAFNKRIGSLLWETKLPFPGYATPAIYEVNGKQFVVIACGGGKLGTPSGDRYVAFALKNK